MTRTPQQQAFIDALLHTSANVALVARAGTGKTTTIMEGVNELRSAFPNDSIIVCAYSKSIERELDARLKKAGHTDWKKTKAQTAHAMGLGLVKYAFRLDPKTGIDERKVRKIIDSRNDGIYQEYGPQIEQLVSKAKGEGFGFFGDCQIGDDGAWYRLADHYGINGFDDTSVMDEIVGAAQIVYRESLSDTSTVDFDDMILFPLVKNLRVGFPADHLIVDEAQDISRAKRALVRKFVRHRTGRMHVVGDDRQAIFGFAGADAESLPNLIEELDATVLPLNVTWRCPKKVVEVANRWVPDLIAAENAAEGEVSQVRQGSDEFKALLENLGPDDAILCRNTAPLVSTAYKLIRAGKACKVEGRSIGVGLKVLAQRWKVASIDLLLQRLSVYQEREVQKALAKDRPEKVEEIEDRVGTLVEVCNVCISKGQTRVSDVVAFIDSLFGDEVTGCVILATYHRSKGREWPNVILWEHAQRCPSKAARQEWQLRQEENLAYVAVTRAMKTLTFVD